MLDDFILTTDSDWNNDILKIESMTEPAAPIVMDILIRKEPGIGLW
jgi:hypothetical protein